MPQKRKYPSNSARQAAYRARVESTRVQQLAQKGLPPLPALPNLPGKARWKAALRSAQQLLTLVHQEMGDYFLERSEVWQESESGLLHQEHAETLEEILAALEQLDT